MSTKEPPKGFHSEQIQYLRSPIWRGAVRQDSKVAKGNPYISGEYIIGQLNRAFGFDGWSVEITSMNEENIDQQNGRFKATYVCTVELTVYAGSRVLKRHGVGAHAMTSKNLVDVVANGQASAYTKAIKNASITFGSQFGLNTVRGGRGWQNNTVPNHPTPPDLGISIRYDFEAEAKAETAVIDEQPVSQPVQAQAPASSGQPASYPLQKLLGSIEDGAPTNDQLIQVLCKLTAEVETHYAESTRDELMNLVRQQVVGNVQNARKAIDEVML